MNIVLWISFIAIFLIGMIFGGAVVYQVISQYREQLGLDPDPFEDKSLPMVVLIKKQKGIKKGKDAKK
jgi:hypothetical protein